MTVHQTALIEAQKLRGLIFFHVFFVKINLSPGLNRIK